MGAQTQEPTYTGIDKYPGVIATVITIGIGTIFLGALYMSATSGHHGGGEHAAGAEHAAPAEHAPAAEGGSGH